MLYILKILWTAPNTALGLLVGIPSLLTGGKVRVRQGAIEFAGGWVRRLFALLPQSNIQAMTLGHTILGTSFAALDSVTNHERVHVRQYERWGPFFLVAYTASSYSAWRKGKNPYFDNRFEIEAYKVKG